MVSDGKLHKCFGRIPRFLNWDISKTWRRNIFKRYLLRVRNVDVLDGPLKLIQAEHYLNETGFVAEKFKDDFKNPAGCDSRVMKIMLDMAHVLLKFGIKPNEQLIGKDQLERLLELDYLGIHKKSKTIDDISPNSLEDYAEQIEKKFSAKKQSSNSGKCLTLAEVCMFGILVLNAFIYNYKWS